MTQTMKSSSFCAFDRPLSNSQGYRSADQMWSGGYTVGSSSTWNANDDLALIGALRERIAGSDFNLGVFLGEGHEALSMITKNATQIYRAYRAIKQGDIIGAAFHLGVTTIDRHRNLTKAHVRKDVANRWLELQYGWLPLVNDCYGAAEFLSQRLNYGYKQRYQVRRKKLLQLIPSSIVAGGKDYQAYGFTQTQLIAFLSEVNTPQLIGLTDPASIAWELTPFSFVADWFIPIGSYLAARGLASALTGTFVTSKLRREWMRVSAFEDFANQVMFIQPNILYSYVDFSRTISTSLSVPFPNIKPLGKIASWKHCANAVALLSQFFKNKPVRD